MYECLDTQLALRSAGTAHCGFHQMFKGTDKSVCLDRHCACRGKRKAEILFYNSLFGYVFAPFLIKWV